VVSPLSKKRGGPPVRLGEGHGKGSGSSVVSPLSKKGGGGLFRGLYRFLRWVGPPVWPNSR
jgi:hypothetical protein